ncbi:MAG: hypothetical protein PF439_08860 [Helicobacteraceae bacterium]|jgi:hypothetical protein|nr:hypothetical protein [Helicobacteraceae bacterium]
MKYSDNNSGDFLFGITLTELILMLFFLLLLISAFMSAEKSSLITKVEQENDRVVKENLDLQLKNKVSRTLSEEMIGALLRFRLGEDENQEKAKQIFKELSNQTKLIAENEQLKSQVEAYAVNKRLLKMDEEFKAQLSRKESILKLLKDVNSTEQLQAIFIKLETLKRESDRSAKNEKRLRQENVMLEKSLKELSSLTKEELMYAQEILKGQVSYLTRRLNMGGGNELPPCWANRKSGKAEYIFSVILGEEAIRVAPRWPKYRAKELKKYGSLKGLFNRDLNVSEFLEITRPIYKDADEKECKHYIYMFDDALTKDGYKTKRLRLENYFYKYEDASKIYERF